MGSQRFRNKRFFLFASAFLMLVCGCGAAKSNKQASSSSLSFEDGKGSAGENREEALEETGNKDGVTTGTEEEGAYPVGKLGDDYILPDAKDHQYTKEELSALTLEELRIARNELFARYGRKFKAEDLNTYFTGKAWYQPSIEAEAFNDSLLNQTEKENLKLVQELEASFSAPVISCPVIGREDFPKIDGSTATLPISQAIYRLSTGASREEAETEIKHWKTTQAYVSLIENRGTNLIIAYEPGQHVEEMLSQYGNNLLIKPIGRDALVFMANGKNPVNSLSRNQVKRIYAGGLTNWKELGGRDQAIKAFQRPENSGSQNLMEKLVMQGSPMAEAPGEYIYSNMEGVLEGLSSYDNTGEALGYSVYYYAKNMYQKPELKFMAINGVMPSSETIRDKSYPFTNDFYAAIRKDEPKDSKARLLFEWLTSDDGQALINNLGYVALKAEERSLPAGFEEEVNYTAQIPLKKGDVILGNGKYLYGRSGIGIFDKRMKLLKFIDHVSALDATPFLVCAEDELLSLFDTQSGKFGLYSLKEERWIREPVYDAVYPTKDGFQLEQQSWAENEEGRRWQYANDYTDHRGRIVRKDVSDDPGKEATEPYWLDKDPLSAQSIECFAEYYPEILERYSADMDDIELHSTDEKMSFCINEENGMAHYYDRRGRFLMDFDKNQIQKEDWLFPSVLTDRLTVLHSREQDYVFLDGDLFKVLKPEGTYSYCNYIGEEFYSMTAGAYLYVYDYQDRPCARFLIEGSYYE